jgi:hypothetical protein
VCGISFWWLIKSCITPLWTALSAGPPGGGEILVGSHGPLLLGSIGRYSSIIIPVKPADGARLANMIPQVTYLNSVVMPDESSDEEEEEDEEAEEEGEEVESSEG